MLTFSLRRSEVSLWSFWETVSGAKEKLVGIVFCLVYARRIKSLRSLRGLSPGIHGSVRCKSMTFQLRRCHRQTCIHLLLLLSLCYFPFRYRSTNNVGLHTSVRCSQIHRKSVDFDIHVGQQSVLKSPNLYMYIRITSVSPWKILRAKYLSYLVVLLTINGCRTRGSFCCWSDIF